MTIKIVSISLILLLATIITGCDRFGIGTEGEGKPTPFAQQYRTGFSGLELSFAQDMPPDKIYQESEYKIGIELRNRGAYDIEFVGFNLDVSGYDEKYMELSKEYIEFKEDDRIKPKLEGRNLNNPEGSYDIKIYTGKNIGMPSGLDEYNAVFVIGVCYKYETRASIDVCIDPYLYDPLRAGKGNCGVGDISMADGQGGPLGVTGVKEQIASSGGKLMVVFTLQIENKGGGKIRDFGERGDKARCVKTGDVDLYVFLADQKLECDFNKETGIAVCRGPIGEGPAYITPLIVKLEYGYFISASKTVKIERISGLFEEETKEFCPSENCKGSESICYNGYGGIDKTKICESSGVCCKESTSNCCNSNDCESITINEEFECRNWQTDCSQETGDFHKYYCTVAEETCCKAKS